MSNYTIHVSVSIDAKIDPIEFNFLSEKLNWQNLVTVIESTTTGIDTPIVLFYKKQDEVESLENQEQLESLLSEESNTLKGLRFYGQKELVKKTVFVLPGNAFVRLGQLVEDHKEIVSSSRRIARWVGILATFIAQDATDHDFDYEFQVLEKLIARKTNKRSHHQRNEEGEEFTLIPNEEEQQENTDGENLEETLLGAHPYHRSFGGRGGFGGGRGHHHGGRHHGRGEHHLHAHHHEGPGAPFDKSFGGPGFGGRGCGGPGFGGRGGFGGPGFGGRGGFGGPGHCSRGPGAEGLEKHPFGRHGGPEFGHPNPFDFNQAASVEEGPKDFGKFARHFDFGHHHKRGGSFGRHGFKHGFGGYSSSEEKEGCGRRGRREHGHRRHGGRGTSDESSSDEDMRAFKAHLFKKHMKHGKHFHKQPENHFHFA